MRIECQILIVPSREGVYKCGHAVKGKLRFRLQERTDFEFIILRFEGKGKCSWSESDDDSTTWYTGNENYANVTRTIMQRPDKYMLAGDYEYPFEYYIPPNIPCSFKDSTCTIAYRIVAEFKKPGFFGNREFFAEVPVYGYVEPCSPQPLIFGLTKKPFSLTSDNVIDVKVTVDKTFLTPGENINVKCTVTNSSDIRVTSIRTDLISNCKYISDGGRTKVSKATIKECKVECPGTDENSVTNISYIVPSLPNLYSIQYSKILVKEYKLQVTAVLPFPHRNASAEIPVVIGERDPESLKVPDYEEKDPEQRPIDFVVV